MNVRLPQNWLLAVCCFFSSMALTAQNTPELLYYKFDGSGISVPNLASNPPAGTATAAIMGGLTQGPAGNLCDGSLIGTGNSSNGDYLNTNWAPNLSSNWTISFRTSNIGASATLFYMFGDINAGQFRCFTNGVAGPNNWILRGPFADVTAYGGAVAAPTMTTFVYDFTTSDIRAYVNGVLVNTVPQSGIAFSGIGPFKVGGYSTAVGLPANGNLDEFRFYSRALSAAEVLELYNPYATSGFLGADQNICPGTPVTITQPWPVSSALWSTGSNNDTLITDTAGTYILNLSGACGSGSDTITLNSLASTASITELVCDQFTAPSGAQFNSSGVYVDTIPNTVGCDSLITINLTIKNSTSSGFSVSSCGTYTSPSGQTWVTSGTYADTISNAVGCDSLITVDLTINSASSSSVTQVACEQYTSPSGQVWTVSGMYTDTILNAEGCDSLIAIDLTVMNAFSASVTLQNGTLTALPAGAVYEWINCGTGQPIPGAASQTYTPIVSGSYAVLVNNGCSDTSICMSVTVSTSGLQNLALDESFVLFPNPSKGEITIQTDAVQELLTVEILNNLGQVIMSKGVQNSSQVSLQLEAEAGVYYVLLTLDSGRKMVKPLMKK